MTLAPPRKTLRVRDIMSSFTSSLSPDDTLADAARKFTNEKISGAPVIQDGVLVGVLSKTDLLERSPFIPHASSGRVAGAMTKKTLTIRSHESAMAAVRILVDAGVHRLIVVNGSGKPIGIVTPGDVLQALVRGDPIQQGEDAFVDRKERHGTPATAIQVEAPATR